MTSREELLARYALHLDEQIERGFVREFVREYWPTPGAPWDFRVVWTSGRTDLVQVQSNDNSAKLLSVTPTWIENNCPPLPEPKENE